MADLLSHRFSSILGVRVTLQWLETINVIG